MFCNLKLNTVVLCAHGDCPPAKCIFRIKIIDLLHLFAFDYGSWQCKFRINVIPCVCHLFVHLCTKKYFSPSQLPHGNNYLLVSNAHFYLNIGVFFIKNNHIYLSIRINTNQFRKINCSSTFFSLIFAGDEHISQY